MSRSLTNRLRIAPRRAAARVRRVVSTGLAARLRLGPTRLLLHMINDDAKNFYMLGTMGLSSSIGLGLALAQDKTVISIDRDGSVLTNFRTLPTIATMWRTTVFC